MGNFKYIGGLFTSLKEVFQKPILLLPFLYALILSVIFSLFTPNTALSAQGALDMHTLVVVLIIVLLQVLISIIFDGMLLAGIRMYVNKEKVTYKNQASKGIKMYWKLLLQTIYFILMIAVPVLILLSIFYVIKGAFSNMAFLGGLAIVLIVIFTVYVIAMILFFLFATVIIAYDGKSAIVSFRESYEYFRRDSTHVVLTMFSLLLFVVIELLVILLVSVPFVMLVQSRAVMFWQNLIMSLIMLPATAAMILYMFKAYNYGGGVKAYVAPAPPANGSKEKKIISKIPADNKKSKAKSKSAKR